MSFSCCYICNFLPLQSQSIFYFKLILFTNINTVNLFLIIFSCAQIRQLDEQATRLMQTHPETADQTYAKQLEINETWQQLTTKANSRKEKLLDSYDLQRYLSDYRDLMSWINSMMGLVANDELGRDVTSAEALLERHQVNMRIKTFW